MLYLIGGGILILLISLWFGINPFKLILVCIFLFILWRIGVLNLVMSILRWIAIRIIYYGEKIFGIDDSEVAPLLQGIDFLEV